MKNNLEICKARDLFIKKGILNRNVLSDEISYSWVRSKLHNISFEILDNAYVSKPVNLLSFSKKTSEVINHLRQTSLKKTKVFVINEWGSILYKTKNEVSDLPEILNFSEESIGTTAVGINMTTEVNSKVVGCEHYNGALTNFISESFMIKSKKSTDKLFVCLLSHLNNVEEHDRVFDQLSSTFIKTPVFDPGAEGLTFNNVKLDTDTKVDRCKPVNSSNVIDEDVSIISRKEKIETSNCKGCKVFTLSVVEKNTIVEALEFYSWNMKKSAEALGIGRSTLYRKIKEYALIRSQYDKSPPMKS